MLHSDLLYPLIFLLVGLLLLLLGRKLFWLFVAAAGFIVGMKAAPYILPHQSELFMLLAAVVLGLVGALLAIFLQKLAVALGGFVAGGNVAAELCGPLLGRAGVESPVAWLCFVIGGILGAILMLAFFNWALIILSSLYGAQWIVRGLPVIRGLPTPRHHSPILLVILAVIGIAVQASSYMRRSPPVA